MDTDTFARLARAQYEALPEEVRAMTRDIELRVADEATPEVLAQMGIDHPDDLLGLFEGLGLSQGAVDHYTGAMPNRIWLYRLPILAFQATGEDSLEDVVRHVLVHEIGHHFGLSDDDMYAIDDAED